MQKELYELVEVVIVKERLELLHLALDVRSALDLRCVHV